MISFNDLDNLLKQFFLISGTIGIARKTGPEVRSKDVIPDAKVHVPIPE